MNPTILLPNTAYNLTADFLDAAGKDLGPDTNAIVYTLAPGGDASWSLNGSVLTTGNAGTSATVNGADNTNTPNLTGSTAYQTSDPAASISVIATPQAAASSSSSSSSSSS